MGDRWFSDWPTTLSKIKQHGPNLLRPLGLRSIIATFLKEEPRKIVVFDSVWTAWCRSLIHILPAAISISLTVLNIRGRFIGRELQGKSGQDDGKLFALQVAAKMQELFLMTSLGSMVLHLIRHKLMYGSGVPLGLLGADKAFTQPSFFWSVEFLGGISPYFKSKNRRDGVLVGALLVYSGITALIAGPATAVLMLPRKMDWPVGGGKLTMNKTEAQLWPTQFDTTHDLEGPCGTPWDQVHRRWCPSAGFHHLYRAFERYWATGNIYQQVRIDDTYLIKTIHIEAHNQGGFDTWSYAAHGPVAGGQDVIATYHTKALNTLRDTHFFDSQSHTSRYLDLADTKEYRVETRLPLVRVLCRLQPTMTNMNSTTIYGFPKIERSRPWRDGVRQRQTGNDEGPSDYIDVFDEVRDNFILRNTTVRSAADIPGAMQTLDNVIVPVSLPAHLNGTIGLVLFTKNTRDLSLESLQPVDVNVCLVDARWVQGRSIQRFESFTNLQQPHDDDIDRTPNNLLAKLGPAGWKEQGMTSTGMDGIADIDRGQIRMSRRWFNFMSPLIGDEQAPGMYHAKGRPNRTTLERITSHRWQPSHIDTMWPNQPQVWRTESEVFISAYFTDSLSRSGEDTVHGSRNTRVVGQAPEPLDLAQSIAAARLFVHRDKPTAMLEYINQTAAPANGEPLAEMTMEAVFTGYAMHVTGGFDIFCIALLLAHAFAALLHTALSVTCYRKQSHETWDSIPQLVALAQQSQPAPPALLGNTCGGIESFETAAAVAVVEISGCGEAGGGTEELHLRFRDGLRKTRFKNVMPVPGGKYGREAESQEIDSLLIYSR